ncbi:MAG TPA: mRNA surveillance protein pelota [Methanomassiliicoccales archaeon]|nr:mRNA surveillance protein pelota [Methanomassiliicoccales archaeon]
MKVLHQDRFKGEIKMQVEVADDLWHLYNILSPGDLVYASTYRREEAKSDKIRAERGEKKRMTLGIRLEKIEFGEFDNRLRLLGVIEEGQQDVGSHHTLIMEEGEVLSVIKSQWKPSQLERVRRAVEDSKKPSVIFVSLDDDEATVAVMRQFGVQRLADIIASGHGKMYATKEEGDYYGEIIAKIKQACSPGVPILVLGPGFAKETLLAKGKEKEPEMFSRSFLYHTGQSGMTGIQELMKRGMGAEVLKDSRVAEETEMVEKLLEAVGKDGLATYGPKEVREAVKVGAVELLLILDSMVREKDVESLMRSVEDSRGRVTVVSEMHEGGKKLESLGGMAALLRYRM